MLLISYLKMNITLSFQPFLKEESESFKKRKAILSLLEIIMVVKEREALGSYWVWGLKVTGCKAKWMRVQTL